jgi:hypothetical protein
MTFREPHWAACFLPPTATLHDFGPLVLGDDPLHLQEQVVFRALAEGPV